MFSLDINCGVWYDCSMRMKGAFKTEKFGKLRFMELMPNSSGDYHHLKCRWKCDCGNEIIARKINVLYGRTRSCGCAHWPKGSSARQWKGHGEIPLRFWNIFLRNANQRNLTVAITIQEAWDLFLKQNRQCALTGDLLTLPPGGRTNGNVNLGTASIDRIDSSKGYTIENVQWVNKDVNMMKGSLSTDRFMEICKKVIDNRMEK